MTDIWTIELNLDDDYANSCAYHIDSLQRTISRNVDDAERKRKTRRWVLVGLAHGPDEAHDKCDQLRNLLCQRNGKQPYGIQELLNNMAKK